MMGRGFTESLRVKITRSKKKKTRNLNNYVGFEVWTAVAIKSAIFWVVR
jgi:hypothetical protein